MYERPCDQAKNNFSATTEKNTDCSVMGERVERKKRSNYRELFWRNVFMKDSKEMEWDSRPREDLKIT